MSNDYSKVVFVHTRKKTKWMQMEGKVEGARKTVD